MDEPSPAPAPAAGVGKAAAWLADGVEARYHSSWQHPEGFICKLCPGSTLRTCAPGP